MAYAAPVEDIRFILHDVAGLDGLIADGLAGDLDADVLGALLELAGETAAPVAPAAEESIDETWAEPVVFDGCSSKGQSRPDQLQTIRIVRKNDAMQGALS